MRHRAWMELALDEAHQALLEGEVPVGAVVVVGERLLAREHNRREASIDPTAHAEMLALRQAAQAVGNWRLADATIYVTLEPCAMCAAAIVQARLQRVVFGAADARMGAAGTRYHVFADAAHEHVVDVLAGIMEDECAAVLRSFFASRR